MPMADKKTNTQALKSLSEPELARAFTHGAAGDSRAYQEALHVATRLITRYLARRGIASAEKDDLIQDILLSVHKARHTYDASRPFLPWLYAIIRYRLADYWRQHYQQAVPGPTLDIQEMQDYLSAPVTEPGQISEELEEAISRLPEKKQRLLYLLHYEGYTAKEAGRLLDMRESAVKVAAHRIYKQLRLETKEGIDADGRTD